MSGSNCRRETCEVFMTLFHAALIRDRIRVAERAMHGAIGRDNAPRGVTFPTDSSWGMR